MIQRLLILSILFLSACSSSQYKTRLEQREKLAASSGLYCEWVNGERYDDLDVELNMRISKRCDSSKSVSMTPFKNTADQNGIMFCCGTRDSNPTPAKETVKKSAKPAATSAATTTSGAPASTTPVSAPAASPDAEPEIEVAE